MSKCETKSFFENESFSPDGSGILFIFSLKIKRLKWKAGLAPKKTT